MRYIGAALQVQPSPLPIQVQPTPRPDIDTSVRREGAPVSAGEAKIETAARAVVQECLLTFPAMDSLGDGLRRAVMSWLPAIAPAGLGRLMALPDVRGEMGQYRAYLGSLASDIDALADEAVGNYILGRFHAHSHRPSIGSPWSGIRIALAEGGYPGAWERIKAKLLSSLTGKRVGLVSQTLQRQAMIGRLQLIGQSPDVRARDPGQFPSQPSPSPALTVRSLLGPRGGVGERFPYGDNDMYLDRESIIVELTNTTGRTVRYVNKGFGGETLEVVTLGPGESRREAGKKRVTDAVFFDPPPPPPPPQEPATPTVRWLLGGRGGKGERFQHDQDMYLDREDFAVELVNTTSKTVSYISRGLDGDILEVIDLPPGARVIERGIKRVTDAEYGSRTGAGPPRKTPAKGAAENSEEDEGEEGEGDEEEGGENEEESEEGMATAQKSKPAPSTATTVQPSRATLTGAYLGFLGSTDDDQIIMRDDTDRFAAAETGELGGIGRPYELQVINADSEISFPRTLAELNASENPQAPVMFRDEKGLWALTVTHGKKIPVLMSRPPPFRLDTRIQPQRRRFPTEAQLVREQTQVEGRIGRLGAARKMIRRDRRGVSGIGLDLSKYNPINFTQSFNPGHLLQPVTDYIDSFAHTAFLAFFVVLLVPITVGLMFW